MTTLNQGRNEIRFNNSGGKCLLENWVEERAVASIIPDASSEDPKKIMKTGHKGLLTTNIKEGFEKETTFRESYKPPKDPGVRQRGVKAELLEKMLYEQVSKEVSEEFNPPPEPVEFKSVTQLDYNIEGFQPTKIEPTAHHDYVSEQPVTFWTEHKEKMHGITQIKPSFDSAFRKNTSFSKPIEEYMDQPKPYEHEVVPKM